MDVSPELLLGLGDLVGAAFNAGHRTQREVSFMGDHRPELGILGEQFEQDRRARSGRPDDEQRLDDLFVERIGVMDQYAASRRRVWRL